MLFFFPRDVLDEIWDSVESVSKGFPTDSESFTPGRAKILQIQLQRLDITEILLTGTL